MNDSEKIKTIINELKPIIKLLIITLAGLYLIELIFVSAVSPFMNNLLGYIGDNKLQILIVAGVGGVIITIIILFFIKLIIKELERG